MRIPNARCHFPRRTFLKQSALATAALGLGGAKMVGQLADRKIKRRLPQPNKSGIEHIVWVMMENRSFDHFLGWLPRANGQQSGLAYLDANGTSFRTHPLSGDYQGCGHPQPAHEYDTGRVEYDNGKCDGWLRAGNNDDYAIGYYAQQDLAFLGNAAPSWTVC